MDRSDGGEICGGDGVCDDDLTLGRDYSPHRLLWFHLPLLLVCSHQWYRGCHETCGDGGGGGGDACDVLILNQSMLRLQRQGDVQTSECHWMVGISRCLGGLVVVEYLQSACRDGDGGVYGDVCVCVLCSLVSVVQ